MAVRELSALISARVVTVHRLAGVVRIALLVFVFLSPRRRVSSYG